MPELDDEQLDGMLRGHFSRSLDAHQGRAEREFRRHLDRDSRRSWKNGSWLVGAFITGMAASVAALWAVPMLRPETAPVRKVVENPENRSGVVPVTATLPAVERVVRSQATDEGVVISPDNTPFRVLRRRQIEHTRWLGADQKVEAEQVTPQDDVVYVKVPTY